MTISKEARKASDIVIDEGKEWLPVYAMPWRNNRNNAGSILTLIQQQIKE